MGDLCQEMGASRVLTMQIAGESLLNAPSLHCAPSVLLSRVLCLA